MIYFLIKQTSDLIRNANGSPQVHVCQSKSKNTPGTPMEISVIYVSNMPRKENFSNYYSLPKNCNVILEEKINIFLKI